MSATGGRQAARVSGVVSMSKDGQLFLPQTICGQTREWLEEVYAQVSDDVFVADVIWTVGDDSRL